VRIGDEIVGFTAASFDSGCKTPARALADAAVTGPLVPLVCFGRGS
jgi:hypothetical protein